MAKLPLAYVCECGALAGWQCVCPSCGKAITKKANRHQRQQMLGVMRGGGRMRATFVHRKKG